MKIVGMLPLAIRDAASNFKKLYGISREPRQERGGSELLAAAAKLASSKCTQDAFILGSGSSVGQLTTEHFHAIRQGVSIGLNLWPLHPFVPDIYYFEGCRDGRGRELWRRHLADRGEQLANVLFAAPTPHFELYHGQSDFELLGRLFGDRIFRPNIFHAVARTNSTLRALVHSQQVGFWRGSLLHFRSSMVAALDLARRIRGIQRVVLVGIDLKDTGYFWQDLGIDYLSESALSPHPTSMRSGGYLSVTDYIKVYAEVLAQKGRPQLLIASPNSALAEFLPIWDVRSPATSANDL